MHIDKEKINFEFAGLVAIALPVIFAFDFSGECVIPLIIISTWFLRGVFDAVG
jgi:hypothetical protein